METPKSLQSWLVQAASERLRQLEIEREEIRSYLQNAQPEALNETNKVRKRIRPHTKDPMAIEKTLVFVRDNTDNSISPLTVAKEFKITTGAAEQRLRKVASLHVGNFTKGSLVVTARDRQRIKEVLRHQ